MTSDSKRTQNFFILFSLPDSGIITRYARYTVRVYHCWVLMSSDCSVQDWENGKILTITLTIYDQWQCTYNLKFKDFVQSYQYMTLTRKSSIVQAKMMQSDDTLRLIEGFWGMRILWRLQMSTLHASCIIFCNHNDAMTYLVNIIFQTQSDWHILVENRRTGLSRWTPWSWYARDSRFTILYG